MLAGQESIMLPKKITAKVLCGMALVKPSSSDFEEGKKSHSKTKPEILSPASLRINCLEGPTQNTKPDILQCTNVWGCSWQLSNVYIPTIIYVCFGISDTLLSYDALISFTQLCNTRQAWTSSKCPTNLIHTFHTQTHEEQSAESQGQQVTVMWNGQGKTGRNSSIRYQFENIW